MIAFLGLTMSNGISMLGTLEEISIEQVLRVLVEGRKTGLLRIVDGSRQALVFLDQGRITHATVGRLQGKQAVWDTLGWRRGSVSFLANEKPLDPNVSESTAELLEEAARLGERFHRIREVISSDRLVFRLGAGPSGDDARCTIGPREWRVIRAVDGIHDVRGLADAAQISRDEVRETLLDLIDLGLVERSVPPKSLRVRLQRRLGGNEAELCESLFGEWKQEARFSHGVFLIELRSQNGRQQRLNPQFVPGRLGEVGLSREALDGLAVREGDDVFVRPIA